jgi:endonuclease/exonuclease/phosphatase family metal-dependent hydrolase
MCFDRNSYSGCFPFIVNHHFPSNTDIKDIECCYNTLEIKLNTQNVRVVLLGDFNVPGYGRLSPRQLTHITIPKLEVM